jgi:protein involved in polysaccharide export with SLBB domain
MPVMIRLALACVCLSVGAQTPSELDLQNLKQFVGAPQAPTVSAPDATPNKGALAGKGGEEAGAGKEGGAASKEELQYRENARLEAELKALKAKDKGPRRFAADLFDTRQASTSATTDGGIAEDYVLGAGDVLAVNVFGSATFEVPAPVDGRGEIVIPKVGSVKVAGLSLGRAKQAVQGLVSRQFSRTTVELAVMKLREVRIFVLGEVYKPGSFLVPSLSSLVNVLGLAGGPTSAGSFRDIRVMRGGQPVHRLDLYPLRAEGRGNVNFSLQSGDVVFVPVVGTRVMVEGAFLRVAALVRPSKETTDEKGPRDFRDAEDPRKTQENSDARGAVPAKERKQAEPGLQLELKAEETAFDAVRLAGGLLPSAYSSFLTLQRVDPNGVISVQNLATTESALKGTRMFFNDTLRAMTQTERTEGVVEIAGRVRVPGRFAFQPGLRVKDLLKGQDQLLPDTYLGRGEVVRTYADERQELFVFDVAKALQGDAAHDLQLQGRDRLSFFAITDLRLPRTVTVVGPFTRPGTFEWVEGLRASDLVFRAGIPQLAANRFYAELAHTQDGKPSQVLRLDLEKLLSTEAGSPVGLKDDAVNPRVEPFDTLSLYEKPDYKTHRVVKVQGQVARPGTYVLDQDRPTLSQLLARAGGLTPEAMPKAGVLMRGLLSHVGPHAKGVNEILERLNETRILVDKTPTAGELQKGALFRPPVLHGLMSSNLNRMVVDFEAAAKGGKEADVELLDGDEIIIPRTTDAAYVVGEAASPFGTYKVKPGMSVADLLEMAGGLTRNADTRNIRLVKADGHIVDSWVKGKKVEPGDTVLVPQRFRRDTAWQDDLAALTPIALLLNAIRWN